MKQKERYVVSYQDCKGNWQDVFAKTIKEGKELYKLVDKNCKFKVLYDSISGNQIMQS